MAKLERKDFSSSLTFSPTCPRATQSLVRVRLRDSSHMNWRVFTPSEEVKQTALEVGISRKTIKRLHNFSCRPEPPRVYPFFKEERQRQSKVMEAMAPTVQSRYQDPVRPLMALADEFAKTRAEDLVSDNRSPQDPTMLATIIRSQNCAGFTPNISRVSPSIFGRHTATCPLTARIVLRTSSRQTRLVGFKCKSLRGSRLTVLILMAFGRWRKSTFTVRARRSHCLLRTTTPLLLLRRPSRAFEVLTEHHQVGKTLAVQLRMHCQDRRLKQIRTSSEAQQLQAACETLVKVPQALLSASSSKFFLASTSSLCEESRLVLFRRKLKFLRVKSATLSRKPAALIDPTDGFQSLSTSFLRSSKVTNRGSALSEC